jgi:hemoglobin
MAVSTMYQRAGGDAFFETLTERFYGAVAADPVLRPLYPDDPAELEAARLRLRDFLIQFWGGPPIYAERRGPPQLRRRHVPFSIGPAERDAWVTHMAAAVRAGGLGALDQQQMLAYFEAGATQMINQET